MKKYIPDLVIINKYILNLPETIETLEILQKEDVCIKKVEDDKQAYEFVSQLSAGKSHVYLTYNKGSFLREFQPGKDVVGNLTYCADHIEGCVYNCVYCFFTPFFE